VLTDAVRVRELVGVLRALEDEGAVPLVFKGAALAHTLYEESWQRPHADADVLIAPESRERVFAVLRRLGYRQLTFISGDLVMYQAPFERVDHLGIDHLLDIHWRIANPQLVSQVLTHDELVTRSVFARVRALSESNGHDYAMRVPSPVDSLLIACVHRVAHHPDLEQPYWIEDIHRLANSLTEPEWQMFAARAVDRSVRTICMQGLKRAEALFQTTLPLDVVTALEAGPSEASAVFVRKGLRPVDRLAADLRALGLVGSARLLREHLVPTAHYMQAKYGVTSRARLPAYYASRVLKGIRKWWRPYVSAAR
jgi:putative nucleotidyltransferase-like protein